MNILKRGLRKACSILGRHGLMTPQATSRVLHRIYKGRWPDLKHPHDLDEKIMWMEFNTDTGMWTRLADKIKVHEYVRAKGLGDILIPQIAVYKDASEIDFNALPDGFALKSSHGSAQNAIVRRKNETDTEQLRRLAQGWLRQGFGKGSGEPHYMKIPRRLFAEQLLPLDNNESPVDYKFMCFGGIPMYCLRCSGRDMKTFQGLYMYYSLPEWNQLGNWVRDEWADRSLARRPENLDRMMKIAATLSQGLPFVRVDLYDINGKIFFGELTFTPFAARSYYFTRECLDKLGDHLSLPEDLH